MLKLAIFDVDGTLIDSQALILRAMEGAHAEVGVAMPPRDTVLSIVGLSLEIAFMTLHPGLQRPVLARLVSAYKSTFSRLRAAGEDEPPFYPGALDALARLDAAGWLLGVATGKARRGLDHLLDGHGIRSRFVATQTADDAPSKPHPGMVLNLLAATGVDAAQAVMIGDTRYDIEMGRAARARALGVSWGYHPRAALTAAGAHGVIDDYGALDAALAEALDQAA
ncbi:MAG: HAD-IA family hydrolase [Pseudomonadota bacterium]